MVYDDVDWYDDGMLDRYQDPGAGAFSYHRGKHWYAERRIEAGEELFLDYSEEWFLKGILGDSGKNIPGLGDYEYAADLCEEWMSKAVEANHSADWLKQQELDQLLKDVGKEDDDMDKVLSLIPKTVEDFTSLLRTASTAHEKPVDAIILEIGKRTTIREQTTVPWIQENGHCLETIVPRRSTIRQAGMGAFAQWPIKRGEVIVPVPTLVQAVHTDPFDMFPMELNGKAYRATGDTSYTKQLLLNY